MQHSCEMASKPSLPSTSTSSSSGTTAKGKGRSHSFRLGNQTMSVPHMACSTRCKLALPPEWFGLVQLSSEHMLTAERHVQLPKHMILLMAELFPNPS